MSEKLFIVIPAYNEELNIKTVVENWYKVLLETSCEGELVVIDDSSTDNTYNILLQMQSEYPLLKPLTKSNTGHGGTVLYGYNYALENGADFVFQTDSDNQTSPDDFKQFWELRNNYDVIIGNRAKRQDGFLRVLISKVLKLVIFVVFGIWVIDSNVPFRLMKANILQKYINKVPENYRLSNVLLAILFVKNKENIKFLPISFKPRLKGKSFVNIKGIFKLGMQTVKDFYELRNVWH